MTGISAEKRQKTDFAWVLLGNVLYSACQWGILVALAKLGSAEQVGEYALGMAVSAPIILFANLQLRALLASELRDRFTFGQYLTFRLASLGAALLVVAGLAACTQPDLRLKGVVVLVGFAQSLEFLSETYYGFLQKHDRMDRVSVSLMLRGPLSLAALCGAMYVTGSVVWGVIGMALARLAVLLGWDSRLGFAKVGGLPDSAVRLEWDPSEMLNLLRMALPLGVISMLVSLNSSIPRYFLEGHSGSAELGIFSALASLLTAGNLVVSAFGQSIFVPVARAYAAMDRAKFRSYVVLAVVLGASLGGAAVVTAALFGREILARLFRPEYGERTDILIRLMIAGTVAFIASGLGYVITAARRLRAQIPVLVASALVAAATSAWSIPRHGLSGAADATLAAACMQLAGIAAIVWNVDRRLRRNAGWPLALDGQTSAALQRMRAETT
jgi:O-antigen/teichoic acid export membrane protein